MTICVAVRVHDGMVMAADSASSMALANGGIAQVYEHGNKMCNLYRGLPIGAVTFGLGSIGEASISTLMKDFRVHIMAEGHPESVAPENYSMTDVCKSFCDFLGSKATEAGLDQYPDPAMLRMGFILTGYSSPSLGPEMFRIENREDDPCSFESQLVASGTDLVWDGQPEAIHRLVLGVDARAPGVFLDLGWASSEAEAVGATQNMVDRLVANLMSPAMPIQDAIDLATFLAELTKQFVRFKTGANTVGGQIEVAAITKHEGFKWISRKHYYEMSKNPTIV